MLKIIRNYKFYLFNLILGISLIFLFNIFLTSTFACNIFSSIFSYILNYNFKINSVQNVSIKSLNFKNIDINIPTLSEIYLKNFYINALSSKFSLQDTIKNQKISIYICNLKNVELSGDINRSLNEITFSTTMNFLKKLIFDIFYKSKIPFYIKNLTIDNLVLKLNTLDDKDIKLKFLYLKVFFNNIFMNSFYIDSKLKLQSNKLNINDIEFKLKGEVNLDKMIFNLQIEVLQLNIENFKLIVEQKLKYLKINDGICNIYASINFSPDTNLRTYGDIIIQNINGKLFKNFNINNGIVIGKFDNDKLIINDNSKLFIENIPINISGEINDLLINHKLTFNFKFNFNDVLASNIFEILNNKFNVFSLLGYNAKNGNIDFKGNIQSSNNNDINTSFQVNFKNILLISNKISIIFNNLNGMCEYSNGNLKSSLPFLVQLGNIYHNFNFDIKNINNLKNMILNANIYELKSMNNNDNNDIINITSDEKYFIIYDYNEDEDIVTNNTIVKLNCNIKKVPNDKVFFFGNISIKNLVINNLSFIKNIVLNGNFGLNKNKIISQFLLINNNNFTYKSDFRVIFDDIINYYLKLIPLNHEKTLSNKEIILAGLITNFIKDIKEFLNKFLTALELHYDLKKI